MEVSSSIKNAVLDILVNFNSFCKKYDIKYCLAYGTLLGAIRHQGFIPWDDDIDVILTTEAYDKLKEIAKGNPYLDAEKRYRILIPGDQNYAYSFIKVEDTKYLIREKNVSDQYAIGLFIDVFRVDYWPESKIAEWIQLKKARFILKLNEICIRGNLKEERFNRINKLLKPVDFLFRILGIKAERLCERLEKQGSRNHPSRYRGNIMSGSGRKSERLPADIFENYVEMPFENHMFPVPGKYDDFLKCIYGDYMKIPPKEKQIGHSYEIIEVRK